MQIPLRQSLVCVAAILATSCTMTPPMPVEPDTAFVDGDRASLIAFSPWMGPGASDETRAAVEAALRSAIESTRRCLGAGQVATQVVVADRIVIRSSGHDEAFERGQAAAGLVGALLLRPGSNPRIVFATDATALQSMLPLTSGEYFGKHCGQGTPGP
jgi:hypothetical protein